MSSKELIQKIQDVFSTSLYPGDDNIVYDNDETHLECFEISKVFRGKKWDDIMAETLTHHREALFFFTPVSYRYYLPAFLLATLRFNKKAGNIPGSLIFSLTPPRDNAVDRVREFQSKMKGFSQAQKEAIREFLEFASQVYYENSPKNPAHEALRRFWR